MRAAIAKERGLFKGCFLYQCCWPLVRVGLPNAHLALNLAMWRAWPSYSVYALGAADGQQPTAVRTNTTVGGQWRMMARLGD